MFMTSSLERLAKNLRDAGRDRFKLVKLGFPGVPDADLDLLLRKGVYPYDYMDAWERFDEEQLPSRDKFFSRLRDSECSVEDYAHAEKVWDTFHIRTMRGYHDLYLKRMLLFILSHRFPLVLL